MSELWKNYRINISNDVMVDAVSPSSSTTSSSTATSKSTSSTSSPLNQLATNLSKNHNNNNNNSSNSNSIPHSPTNKKPFTSHGSNIKIQYSPTHQQNSASNGQKQSHTYTDTSIQSTPPLQASAQPKLSLNQLNCYNHSSDDSYSIKMSIANTNNENKEDNPSLFPQLHTQNQRVSFNLEHHSNVNPNSKDTHVWQRLN